MVIRLILGLFAVLDVKTAFLLWVTQAGTLSILLIAIWLHGRDQKHFLWFGLGFATHAFGLGLVAGRNEIPDVISIHIANFVSLLAFSCWLVALKAFDRRPPPRLLLLPCLIWTAANLLPAIREEFAYRLAAYDVAASTGFLLMAATVIRLTFSTRLYRRMLALVWILQALCGLVFAALAIKLMPGNFQETSIATYVGIVGVIGFMIAVILLAKMMMDHSEARLQILVRTDPLTGALNRRGFNEAFEQLAMASHGPTIAVVIFDLDHFKQINDRYGHQTGDMVLSAFAHLCQSLLPDKAAFGRTGGEEFAAVLAVADARDAALFAETTRLAMAEKQVPIGLGTASVTVSIGIAVSPLAEANLDQLMMRADKALYKAKAQGRNRTAVTNGKRVFTVPPHRADPLDDQADRQVAILKRLAAAAGQAKRS